MKAKQLMQEFEKFKGGPSESWLENQYPAKPAERLVKENYLNYQNIEDNYGKEAAESMKQFLGKHPDYVVVVLAPLQKSGRIGKHPRAFFQDEARYYPLYELFACASHLSGFVELFHNFIRP